MTLPIYLLPLPPFTVHFKDEESGQRFESVTQVLGSFWKMEGGGHVATVVPTTLMLWALQAE